MTVNKLGMYIFVLKGLRRTFLEEPQKKKKKIGQKKQVFGTCQISFTTKKCKCTYMSPAFNV